MHNPRLLPSRLRAAGIVCATLAIAACDEDGLVTPRDGCTSLRQTRAEIDAGREQGLARVRVSLVSRLGSETPSQDKVSLEGAELYLGNTCFRLENASAPSLSSLENDMGALVAEGSVDPGVLTDLLLRTSERQSGSHTYTAEKIRLGEAVELKAGQRTDIYLALTPVGTTSRVTASFVAAGAMPWDAATMVYDPVRGGKMSLPNGFAMELPVGSVARPMVFGVGEYRGRDVSATYNVWPEGGLQEPVTITFPIDRARIPSGMGMSDYGGRVNGAVAVSSVTGNTATVTASSMGQVRMGTSVPYMETATGQRLATRLPAGGAGGGMSSLVNNVCYQRLLAERTNLFNTLNTNAGVRTTLCEDVAPYVHILIVNLSRAGLGANGYLYPRIVFPGVQAADGRFFLREITTHMSTLSNDFAAINGFTWDGDTGCCGGYGTPIGTVYMNGARVSPWFSGTEVIIGFGPHSPSSGTPAAFFERVSGASINITGYTNWMVPSTTSIVKNGACSRAPGGEVNRWSTVGIGNGVLVMASSVSNTTTTAYELCSVYEGLNVLGGAHRLDGGPSAAIWWLGTTLNLLSGTDYFTFGYERDIPYAVAAVTQ